MVDGVDTLKGVTLSERIRHRVSLFVEDFREDKKVVGGKDEACGPRAKIVDMKRGGGRPRSRQEEEAAAVRIELLCLKPAKLVLQPLGRVALDKERLARSVDINLPDLVRLRRSVAVGANALVIPCGLLGETREDDMLAVG